MERFTHAPRRGRILGLGLLLASLVLPACAPRYDGFDCFMLNDTPSGAICTEREIVVARGEALVVRIAPISDTRTDYESDTELELRSSDEQLLDVRPGAGGEQTLIGQTIGETSTEVWLDGELVDEVPTRVVAWQPRGPSD